VTVLGALAARRPSNAIQATPWGDWGDGATTQTWSGANVTTANATQLLTVYACTRFIADGISTLPVDVLRRAADGSPIPANRAPEWIAQPTADLDFISWCGQVLSSLLLAGNAYCVVSRAGGVIDEMIPIDPTKVEVHRDRGRKGYRVNGKDVDPFSILHIPGVMWPGSDVGLSPVEAARQSIGTGMSAQEYAGRFFAQDSTPGGVIEVPGEMTPEKTSAMAKAWAKKHAGKSKNGLPGVLVGGASWKQTSVTNEQAQFLETRQFTATEIAGQMFLIDPAEMGLPVAGSSLTYANLEQRNARKVQVTFLPWIIRVERALTGLLPRPQYLKFNVNGLLRGDMKTRFEAYGLGIDKKFMVPNEARAFEDWTALEGGDEVVASSAPAPPAPPTEPAQ
jgi:HK97 family phage portal protein